MLQWLQLGTLLGFVLATTEALGLGVKTLPKAR